MSKVNLSLPFGNLEVTMELSSDDVYINNRDLLSALEKFLSVVDSYNSVDISIKTADLFESWNVADDDLNLSVPSQGGIVGIDEQLYNNIVLSEKL